MLAILKYRFEKSLNMSADKIFCDAIVLCPLDVEVKALQAALENKKWIKSPDDIFSKNRLPLPMPLLEYSRPLEEDMPLEKEIIRTIIIVRLEEQGVMHAAIETAIVASLFNFSCMVSFGIAGGLKDVKIGDVIIPKEIIYYEKLKYTEVDGESITENRSDTLKINNKHKKALIQAIVSKFNKEFTSFNIHTGSFASGEKLFADGNISKELIVRHGKLLGVDMESVGVGMSLERHSDWARGLEGAIFFAVKGVSDLCNKEKNSISPIEQEKNQKIAAQNAANVLIEMLSDPLIIESKFIYEDVEKINNIEISRSVVTLLEPYGMNVRQGEVFRAIDGRLKDTIPVYFRWNQSAEHLNWVDFKILCAMSTLPKNVFDITPLVTIKYDKNRHSSEMGWQKTVRAITQKEAITNQDINLGDYSKSKIARQRGIGDKVKKEIEKYNVEHGDSNVNSDTEKWLMYMLLQQKNSRMLNFSWAKTRYKWDNLIWAYDAKFAVVTWETFSLGNCESKYESPSADILIDTSMQCIREWLDSSPPLEIMRDFIGHFIEVFKSSENETKAELDKSRKLTNKLRKLQELEKEIISGNFKIEDEATLKVKIKNMAEFWLEKYFSQE